MPITKTNVMSIGACTDRRQSWPPLVLVVEGLRREHRQDAQDVDPMGLRLVRRIQEAGAAMRLRRIGNHKSYHEVIREPGDAMKELKAALPKPPKKKERIEAWAQHVWRRYGDMFGDWAVAGMDDAERERYIGGGDRKLNKQAEESIEDGLCDAINFLRVPMDLVDQVKRRVLVISGMK